MTLQVCKAVFKRDVLLYIRRQSETSLPLIFFVMIVSLFSISNHHAIDLTNFSGPILWIATLLSILLSAESLYKNDYESGYLEQLVLNSTPLSLLILAKIMAHIVCIGLPLLLLAPLLGLVLHLPVTLLPTISLSFFMGIPALCFMASIGSAITVSLHRGGLLLSILLIPLMIPVMLFGCSAIQVSSHGLSWQSEAYLLLAFLIIAGLFSPILSAFAIKLGLN